MNVIKENIDKAVLKEYTAACNNFPLFDSAHEAYAIILEEVEEARDQMLVIENRLKMLWTQIKNNESIIAKTVTLKMLTEAEELACEAVQIGAMCLKYMKSAERGFSHEISKSDV